MTNSSSKTLFTLSDILTLMSILVTVVGIVIAFLQWGFDPTAIVVAIIGVSLLTYLLIGRVLPWFRHHFPLVQTSPEIATETSTGEPEVVEEPSITLASLPPSDQAFLQQAVEKLDSTSVSALMLLAQDHRIELPAVTAAIEEQLQRRFGAGNVYRWCYKGNGSGVQSEALPAAWQSFAFSSWV